MTFQSLSTDDNETCRDPNRYWHRQTRLETSHHSVAERLTIVFSIQYGSHAQNFPFRVKAFRPAPELPTFPTNLFLLAVLIWSTSSIRFLLSGAVDFTVNRGRRSPQSKYLYATVREGKSGDTTRSYQITLHPCIYGPDNRWQ